MINEIISLGAKIENKWDSFKDDKDKFPQICLDALESFDYKLDLSSFEEQVSQWLLKNESLPEQLNVYNGFGHPPVTLFNNGKFVIDVYFWTNYNTSIHSHSFAGAFKVLYGQSLHEIFELKQKNSFTHDIKLNEIKLSKSAILAPGSSHPIKHGEDFCHRVIHLDQPTLTLCIRTLNDSQTPQWHYFENGLSIRKREMDQNIYKKLFYYQYLFHRDSSQDQAYIFLKSFLDKLEDSQVMNLFEQVLTDGMGLEEDIADTVHQFIIDKYSQQEWFKHYEQYYQEIQSHIAPQDDTPLDRFYAHAANSKYSRELSEKLIEQIDS